MSAPIVLLSVDRSFWNRLGLSRFTYERSLARAGARVRRYDHRAIAAHSTGDRAARAVGELLEGIDGLVLSGGGDVDPRLYGGLPDAGLDVRPARDRFELMLVDGARRLDLPILAICRGLQLLNVALGGTLIDLRGRPEKRRRHRSWRGHPVLLDPRSRLAVVLGCRRLSRVVTLHGQALGACGREVRPVGWAGDGVIEAVEARGDVWRVGVQWHPELSTGDLHQRRLFESLVVAAGERGKGSERPSPC